jgi:flagellar basal-body rod protein FlgG
MGIIEIGGMILSRAAERVDFAAQNMANLTTPGYKSRSSFSAMIAADSPASTASAGAIDFTNGALANTGNPLDMAIAGSGFFVVRGDDGVFYTRNGQFTRSEDGRLKTAEGMVLQSVSGDLVLGEGDPAVLADGTVTSQGEPVGRVAVVNFDDQSALRGAAGTLFTAPEASAKPSSAQLRQGMLEGSNVSTAAEMISIMSSLRGAGAGQKVVQLYDDLMGRAITAFGQS